MLDCRYPRKAVLVIATMLGWEALKIQTLPPVNPDVAV